MLPFEFIGTGEAFRLKMCIQYVQNQCVRKVKKKCLESDE